MRTQPYAVVAQGGQPPDRFDRIDEYQQVMPGCKLYDVIEPREIGLVRLAQIVVREIRTAGKIPGKGLDTIGSYSVLVGGIVVARAGHVDPSQGIESVRFAIGEI